MAVVLNVVDVCLPQSFCLSCTDYARLTGLGLAPVHGGQAALTLVTSVYALVDAFTYATLIFFCSNFSTSDSGAPYGYFILLISLCGIVMQQFFTMLSFIVPDQNAALSVTVRGQLMIVSECLDWLPA
jgi:hypothetical protein